MQTAQQFKRGRLNIVDFGCGRQGRVYGRSLRDCAHKNSRTKRIDLLQRYAHRMRLSLIA